VREVKHKQALTNRDREPEAKLIIISMNGYEHSLFLLRMIDSNRTWTAEKTAIVSYLQDTGLVVIIIISITWTAEKTVIVP